MGNFAEYLSRKISVASPAEEHPAVIVAGALDEAKELGRSVAGMFNSKSRLQKLEALELKRRGR